MAFAGLGTDPCSILNVNALTATAPAGLWISGTPSTEAYTAATDDLYYSQIAVNGLTQTFSQVYSATLGQGQVLNTDANSDTSTNYPVKKYMLNKTVSQVLLGTQSQPFYILNTTPSVSEHKDAFDATAAFTRLSPYIITKAEIYNQNNINEIGTLLSFYTLEQQGSLTDTQKTAKEILEDKNKKFFAAFLAEYCFYRTRYQWLLQKYFNIFRIPAASYGTPTAIPTASVARLFNGQGTTENQYSTVSATSLTQSDYLKGIAFHLATLSKRMANMREILARVNAYYDEALQDIQRLINANAGTGSNAQLQRTLNALRNSANESKKAMEQTQFMQAAVQYTSEKNRYANVLLGLYAFLNIAALAMIFKLRN